MFNFGITKVPELILPKHQVWVVTLNKWNRWTEPPIRFLYSSKNEMTLPIEGKWSALVKDKGKLERALILGW